MSNLPKVTWDIDPVMFQIPRALVLVVAALIAGYSLVQDIRRNKSSAAWTLVFFAGLVIAAWRFKEASLGFPYYLGLVAALVAEGVRRKASDHYVTAALFAALGFIAWRYLGDLLELRYYSLLFVGVFLGGYSLLKWQIVRGGGPAEDAGDFIVYGVLGVLVGARLGHVLFYDLDKAIADPKWIFQIWTGGLASHGAVIGLILAMWLFTKQRRIPFLEGADRFAFSAALGATLVRIGNLMNSEIVGRRVPGDAWGFQFPRFDRQPPAPYRYPTQLGEIVLGLFVLGALYVVDSKLGREKRPRGALISTFFLVYFPGRFLIEYWKEYEPPVPVGTPYPSELTTGQLLSLPGILLGIVGLVWSFRKQLPAGWGHPATDLREENAPRRKKKRKKAHEEREDDDEEASEREDEREDNEDDERDEDGRDADEPNDDDDDDGGENDDGRDADEPDDDDDDDGGEDDERRPPGHDPDIDDEFDEKGALKRRRGSD